MHVDDDVVVQKVEALFDLDRFEECIALAKRHLYSSEIEDLPLYNYIINAYANLEEYVLADKFCDDALKEYPNISTFLYLKSLILFAQNKRKSAKTYVENALSMDGNNARYLALLARIYFALNQTRKAKKIIDKALALESNDLDFQLLNSLILYHLDNEKEAEAIINTILKQDPFHEGALDLKQKVFSTKMSARKSILAQLLRQNPFDKSYQKDIKFITFYYRYVPVMMIVSICFVYLYNIIYIEALSPLKPLIFFGVSVTAFIGAQDKRFNIPFLLIVSTIALYFDDAKPATYIGIFFLVIIYNYFFYALWIWLRILFEAIKDKTAQLKSKNKNVLFYFLVSYSFYEEDEVDWYTLKRYYASITLMMMGSLASFLLYQQFGVINTPLKLLLTSIFFIVAIKSAKNLLLTTVYTFMTVLIINHFKCDGGIIYCFFIALLSVPIFLGVSNYIKYRKENE